MELHQLTYLVAVVEEASFTRAAARLRVAQPGVSAQIRQLERELGQSLLDRSGRGVRLTAVGAAVLPYARAALEAVDGVRFAVDELSGLLRGHVTVGTVASLASGDVDLPGLLADFHRDHPAIQIILTEGDSDRLIEAVRVGELDLAFVGLGASLPTGVAIQLLVSEPLMAIVSHGHPLARRRSITLEDLREQDLISLPCGTGVRSCIDGAFVSARLQPRIAFEASDPRVLAQLATRGLGVAILPDSHVRAHRADLHAIEITRPRMLGRLALAWRAEGPSSPAARALTSRVRA